MLRRCLLLLLLTLSMACVRAGLLDRLQLKHESHDRYIHEVPPVAGQGHDVGRSYTRVLAKRDTDRIYFPDSFEPVEASTPAQVVGNRILIHVQNRCIVIQSTGRCIPKSSIRPRT